MRGTLAGVLGRACTPAPRLGSPGPERRPGAQNVTSFSREQMVLAGRAREGCDVHTHVCACLRVHACACLFLLAPRAPHHSVGPSCLGPSPTSRALPSYQSLHSPLPTHHTHLSLARLPLPTQSLTPQAQGRGAGQELRSESPTLGCPVRLGWALMRQGRQDLCPQAPVSFPPVGVAEEVLLIRPHRDPSRVGAAAPWPVMGRMEGWAVGWRRATSGEPGDGGPGEGVSFLLVLVP